MHSLELGYLLALPNADVAREGPKGGRAAERLAQTSV